MPNMVARLTSVILLLAVGAQAATRLSRSANDCVPDAAAVTAASTQDIAFFPTAFQTDGDTASTSNKVTQVRCVESNRHAPGQHATRQISNAIGFEVTYKGNLKVRGVIAASMHNLIADCQQHRCRRDLRPLPMWHRPSCPWHLPCRRQALCHPPHLGRRPRHHRIRLYRAYHPAYIVPLSQKCVPSECTRCGSARLCCQRPGRVPLRPAPAGLQQARDDTRQPCHSCSSCPPTYPHRSLDTLELGMANASVVQATLAPLGDAVLDTITLATPTNNSIVVSAPTDPGMPSFPMPSFPSHHSLQLHCIVCFVC